MIKNVSATKLSILITIFAVIFAAGYFYSKQNQIIEVAPMENPSLVTTINDCDEITERAASHLQAIVEFQRLEIIGRKARVFKLCMQDHGYTENNRWLTYSLPIAKDEAHRSGMSVDEALENLRRSDMKMASGESKRPAYWVKTVRNRSEQLQ